MPDIVTFNVLVDTFCKEGKVLAAEGVLKTMTEMSGARRRDLQFIDLWTFLVDAWKLLKLESFLVS